MKHIVTPLTGGIAAMPVKEKKSGSRDIIDPLIKLLLVTVAIAVIVLAYKSEVLFNWGWLHVLRNNSPFFRYLFLFNTSLFLFFLIFRTARWFKYQPYDSSKVEEWPEITILVPAYNEGETVYTTIESIASCDYPADKLKIIAIDDGSKDDTYSHMCRAKADYPDMVKLIRFNTNKGKREGIFRGFQEATSPYIMTVDSDTRLAENAIKELITPLVLNPKLGAVTGRIRIWNKEANILTQMLHVNFAMAFDFTRAIQSTFSTVFCTSGAFSAYRADVMGEIMESWLNQTFLNRTCTYGEDRSLANHILRLGYGTAFQRTAVAFTIVPESFVRILKMLTRWARSNIRESVIFSKIMYNPNRKGNYFLPTIEFFANFIVVIMHLVLFYFFLFSGFINGQFILRSMAYTLLFGFFYMLYYIRIEGIKDFPYILLFAVFSSIFTIWIFTHAGLTLTTRRWSTRDITAPISQIAK